MYIVVVGCGRVGSQLATSLSEEGHDVAVIDKNKDSFRRLGSTFNGLAVEGLGFDQDVLKEAGIEQADVFVALTDLDNTNMMAVEVATKIFNVPRAIARLYNPTRELTYQRLGIEYVCGTTMLAEATLQQVLAPRVNIIATVANLHIVRLTAAGHLDGRTVGDIDGDSNFKVITVIRRMKNILCQPDTVVRAGDELVIITRKKMLPEIDKLADVDTLAEVTR